MIIKKITVPGIGISFGETQISTEWEEEELKYVRENYLPCLDHGLADRHFLEKVVLDFNPTSEEVVWGWMMLMEKVKSEPKKIPDRREFRQDIIDAMTEEAENGVWSSSWLENDSFIMCTRDAGIDPNIEGRVRGVVQMLKARGDVKIEPYSEEGVEDTGDYIKATITPRTC